MNSFLLSEYETLSTRCNDPLCHPRWHRELRDIVLRIRRDYTRNPSSYEYLNDEENYLLRQVIND